MKIKFIILGCGYSFGVPKADGSWGKCDPKVKKNIAQIKASGKFGELKIILYKLKKIG